MINAACSPKNFATVSTEFLPTPEVANRVSTITRFATTAAASTSCAVDAGGMTARVTEGLPVATGTSCSIRGS